MGRGYRDRSAPGCRGEQHLGKLVERQTDQPVDRAGCDGEHFEPAQTGRAVGLRQHEGRGGDCGEHDGAGQHGA